MITVTCASKQVLRASVKSTIERRLVVCEAGGHRKMFLGVSYKRHVKTECLVLRDTVENVAVFGSY